MKIIFLDVDGVLNYRGCQYTIKGFVGIDPEKVKLLAKIVRASNAKIVLTSTWRSDYIEMNELGIYLKNALEAENLTVYDCVNYVGYDRGQGIVNWLKKHTGVTDWVVLDDEIFPDYEKLGILSHIIKSSFYDAGLQSNHVWDAIAKLNGYIKGALLHKNNG